MMRYILFILFLISLKPLNAQESFRISKPELSFSNNTLTIRYDITGCGSGEYLDIRLIILNSKGDTIKPTYISGDIGKRINCGMEKSISWNVVKDNFQVNEDFNVLIRGEKSVSPPANLFQNESKGITRGNVLLSSVILPGLGQKKASGKAAYFAFSGLVYGAIGSSLYLNLKSKQLYNDYQAASGTERDNLYNKSIKTFNNSQYLLYGAAGIWAANIIWSAVITIKENPVKKMNITLTSTQYNEFLVSAKWTF